MKVVLATTNPGKLQEFKELSSSEKWLELTMAPAGFNPAETGKTFHENAKIKASEAARSTGLMSMADDSGLIVEALNGRPGILSARYCEGSDADRRNKVLDELKNIPEDRRQAAFICAMVVCDPNGAVPFSTIRYWEGAIVKQERGENGFGYDPVFQPLKYKQTAAELSREEKNRISHRAQAWAQVMNFLKHHHSLLERT